MASSGCIASRAAARTPRSLRLLREFTHFFALVLWVAAALAFLADLTDPEHGMRVLGTAVVAVILVNGLFSFWQEDRAEEAFRLAKLLPDAILLEELRKWLVRVRGGRSMDLGAPDSTQARAVTG